MTRTKNMDAAPEDLVDRTRSGPHKGWITFDEKFEGARYQLLQELVSADPFDARTAEVVLSELEDFAQSYGYATADSVLCDYGDLSEDELEEEENAAAKIIMDGLFANDGENDQYFTDVYTSENALKTASKTQEAIEFLGLKNIRNGGHIWSTVNTAFLRGRDMKKEEYDAANAPRP